MKKQILTIGTIILIVFGSVTFIGCGNAENNESEHTEHMDSEEHAMYQCPMKCEGDKMYEEEGSCPKCGMDLTKNEVKEKTASKKSSCMDKGNKKGHQCNMKKEDSDKKSSTYQCPMKCEGDKTYDKAGDCPKCGMSLQTTKTDEK